MLGMTKLIPVLSFMFCQLKIAHLYTHAIFLGELNSATVPITALQDVLREKRIIQAPKFLSYDSDD